MEKMRVEGLHKLNGEVSIHGAKNSVLPVLAATFLVNGTSEISNCPRLSDVAVSVKILQELGCAVIHQRDVVTVDTRGANCFEISDRLMREMRSSIVFLGAILARCGKACISFPGGCELGPRPIDMHLAALQQMGVTITEERGQLCCTAEGGLRGCEISLSMPSVGATENVILAAVTAQGRTILRNAAREPEIVDLCEFLLACGARIRGQGEGMIWVEGVEQLHGCAHRIISDRIETATYMAAAAVTGGSVRLFNMNPEHVAMLFPVFEEAGCRLAVGRDDLVISAPSRLHRLKSIRTMPYPGFPTDAQAPIMAMACVADGTSVFIENIFESRYKHVSELMRLGAKIKIESRVAIVEGVPLLSGAPVECTDLRGGAALLIAALAAEGCTEITCLHHLDRGYEKLENHFRALGAVIERGTERDVANDTIEKDK